MINLDVLRAPFDPKKVSWRLGSTTADKTKGMALAYIDARDVQDRLDEACGVGKWQCRYALQGQTTICEIGVKIDDEWIWKADGAGATDVEAEKGQLSDAFKRAAVKWGVGRYLYDVASPWVEIEGAGKSYKIKAGEIPKLIAALNRSGAPQEPTTVPVRNAQPPAKPAASEAPNAPADKAREWAKREIERAATIKTGPEYDAWYTPAMRGAVSRLKDLDKDLFDKLTDAISNALERINPIGA